MTDFLAMGGYGAYVWPAYGFAALVLIVLLAQSWRNARRRAAELEQLRHLARPERVRRARIHPAHGADDPGEAELSYPVTE